MTISFADGRKNSYTLDISEEETAAFTSKPGAREVKRRGRKPGTKNKPKTS